MSRQRITRLPRVALAAVSGQVLRLATRLGFAALWAIAAPLGLALAQPVSTPHVRAELVAAEQGVVPGGEVAIGLRLQHQPHWHTYWRNPGDSGLPTTLNWRLPPGAQAGPIEWPVPQRLPFGPLVNYGYEGDVLLPLRLRAAADARPGEVLQIEAEAQWLVCREVCVPESATLALRLPVLEAGRTAAASPMAARFAQAAAQRPQPLPEGWRTEVQRAGQTLHVRLLPPAAMAAGSAAPIEVFPYAEQLLQAAHHRVYQVAEGWLVELTLDPNAAEPTRLEGLVVARGHATGPPWGGAALAAEFSAPVRSVASLGLPPDARPLAVASAPATHAAGGGAGTVGAAGTGLGGLSWWTALGLALLGGMLLNLMPCVFPVLSIKLLGLAQQQGSGADSATALRAHALAYSIGVIGAFLALAALLLALRAAGQAVGWGFQLQSPGVVFGLALLFAALGLNLMGVFEFNLGLPQSGGAQAGSHPLLKAMGSGVLAVVAASPCTAPFMGAALGAALTQPPAWALGVFAALGLGMALPYAGLVMAPGWRRRLPRPGVWMLRLKQWLAFPMFATVVWLLWVLGQQVGVDGLGRGLMGLLGLGMGAWAWGLLQSRDGRPVSAWLAGALALALLAWAWPAADAGMADDNRAGASASASASATGSSGLAARPDALAAWRPYSDAALQAELAAGRTVFVDFTAAWCVSCQVNKKAVLERADVVAAFDRAGVVRMRADWTRRDPEISAALARLGRSGVPVYLLQRPGQPPQLLPEILSTGLVLDALGTVR